MPILDILNALKRMKENIQQELPDTSVIFSELVHRKNYYATGIVQKPWKLLGAVSTQSSTAGFMAR
jgi:hypothetical protein